MAVAVGAGIVGMLVLSGVEVAVSVGGNVGIVVRVGSGVVVLVMVGGGWVGVLSVWLMDTPVLSDVEVAVAFMVGVAGLPTVVEHPNSPKLNRIGKKNHPKKCLAWLLGIV